MAYNRYTRDHNHHLILRNLSTGIGLSVEISICSNLGPSTLERVFKVTNLVSRPPFVIALCEVAIRHCDTSSVEDGLRQLEVHGLCRHGRRPQRVPDLLAALESGRSVPELITLTAKLTLRQRHVRLPSNRLVAEREVFTKTTYKGEGVLEAV